MPALRPKKIIITVVCGLALLFIAEEFFRRVIGGFAGSYPFAESWNIPAKETDVLKAVAELKNEFPSLKVPNDSSFRNSYWFYINFYYADTKQIAHAWTRPGRNEFTTDVAFISLSSLNKQGDENLINKDFWYLANRREINKFKEQVIDRLEKIIYKQKLQESKHISKKRTPNMGFGILRLDMVVLPRWRC